MRNDSDDEPNIQLAFKHAKSIYFLYLVFLVYCLLTVAGIEDIQLVLPWERAHLPILNINVSILGFLFAGPVITVIIFVYFILILVQIQNITNLTGDEVFIRTLFPGALSAPDSGPGTSLLLQKFIILLLLYLSLPITLLLFAFKIYKRHDFLSSAAISIIFFISLCLIGWFWAKLNKAGPWNSKSKKLLPVSIITVVLFAFILVIITEINDGKFTFLNVDLSGESFARPVTVFENPDQALWVDLRNINLNGAYLDNSIITKVDFTASQLKHAVLAESNLELSSFNFANMEKANLNNANLWRANMVGVNLMDSIITWANFREANLMGAELGGATAFNTSFQNASLHSSSLKGAHLQASDFSNADLANADLSETHLAFVNLSYANLSGADFRNADFSNPDDDDSFISILKSSGVPGWLSLYGIDFNEIQFKHGNVAQTILDLIESSKQNFIINDHDYGPIFRRMFVKSFKQVNSPEAWENQYIGANLYGANLTNADFTGADLSDTDLRLTVGLTKPQLCKAKSLARSILDDGMLNEILDSETGCTEKLY
jgi:uncharacterized protein YjbI with pentapeptide repeats